jgi:radical SAM superfamily enzyme YgiQ (UPF0313 family)
VKEVQKMQNTHRSLLESVRRIQSYGMEVMAGFIVGFDNDPEDIFDRQAQFIQKSAIPLAMEGILQALPGTQLYRQLQKEGRLVGEDNGNNLCFHLSFIPRMGARQLIEGFDFAANLQSEELLRAGTAFSGTVQPECAAAFAESAGLRGAGAVDSEAGDS